MVGVGEGTGIGLSNPDDLLGSLHVSGVKAKEVHAGGYPRTGVGSAIPLHAVRAGHGGPVVDGGYPATLRVVDGHPHHAVGGQDEADGRSGAERVR